MRSKSRLIAALAAMVACVAMVGTGFASWVILDSQTKTATGNVTAEAVSDEGISLDVVTSSGSEIVYGSPQTMEAKNPWLVEDQSKGQGKFTVDITVTVGGNIGSLTIGFVASKDAFKTAVEQGLIAYPTYSVGETTPTGAITETGKITIDQSAGDGSATLKFDGKEGFDFGEETVFHIIATFGWGEAFGNQNPYNYFNDGTKTSTGAEEGTSGGITKISDADGWTSKTLADSNISSATTWGDVAKEVLGWMNTNFNTMTYTITFTAAQAAATAGA